MHLAGAHLEVEPVECLGAPERFMQAGNLDCRCCWCCTIHDEPVIQHSQSCEYTEMGSRAGVGRRGRALAKRRRTGREDGAIATSNRASRGLERDPDAVLRFIEHFASLMTDA